MGHLSQIMGHHIYTWSNPASGDIHRASQAIAEVPSPRCRRGVQFFEQITMKRGMQLPTGQVNIPMNPYAVHDPETGRQYVDPRTLPPDVVSAMAKQVEEVSHQYPNNSLIPVLWFKT